MSDPRFFYTPEIEKKIPSLIKHVLSLDVISAIKITEGEENHVYRVETPKKKIILRILGVPYMGGNKKIRTLTTKLEENTISSPKLLQYALTPEEFPYGYMIYEYIEGKNGKDAITDGDITFEDFHRKLFSLLKNLHLIRNDKFNFLTEEGFDTILAFKLDQLNWCFTQLTDQQDVYEKKEIVEKILTNVLTPLLSKIHPVLIHYDPMPSNCMYTPDKKLVLVDWDSAASESFMRDIAWITYWGSQGNDSVPLEERQQILRRIFLDVYRDFGFSEQELLQLEKLYHVLISVELLPYFLLSQKNMKGYEETKERFQKLITEIM